MSAKKCKAIRKQIGNPRDTEYQVKTHARGRRQVLLKKWCGRAKYQAAKAAA